MTIAEALEARGEARGKLEEKIAIGMALLKKGLDKVLVVETTNLDINKVEELIKELDKNH